MNTATETRESKLSNHGQEGRGKQLTVRGIQHGTGDAALGDTAELHLTTSITETANTHTHCHNASLVELQTATLTGREMAQTGHPVGKK